MGDDAGRYRRFLDGDDNGLVEIIDTYHESLTLFLNSFVHDPDLAEELMQDTFVRLATKRPRFSGRSTFKTWLFTIARNCAIDYLRKNRRHISLEEHQDLPDTADIERDYLREEQKIILHKALRQIRPEYAQALYLMYFEDFDTEAISKVMHKTRRQVSNLIYRGKQALRTELERVGFQYEDN
jgi:RNA polymerase sigma-70 factor (ECF subfamily)